MSVSLKPIDQQVIVITGASSGIGLAAAYQAARKGAKLALVARNGEALEHVAGDLAHITPDVMWIEADVSRMDDVERVADAVIARFGGFDSWVNNAGVPLFGMIEDIPISDQRQLFEVNFWGVVYGSLVALRHLRERGGAIVNVGSILSDRAILLQGTYSASKHAVKAFTDALRMEIQYDGLPVSVSLVKPSAMNSLYGEHARSYLRLYPTLPPPVYDPVLSAQAIIHCCTKPCRHITVGFHGYMMARMGEWFPRLVDKLMIKTQVKGQQTEMAGPPDRMDNLYEPRADGAIHGARPVRMHRQSWFTLAQMHPWLVGVLVVTAAVIGPQLASTRRRRRLSRLFA